MAQHPRVNRLQRGRVLRACVALAACALPVIGWRSLGDRIPPATKQPLTTVRGLHWIGPGIGPVYLFGRATEGDVLFAGDSRTGAGIVTSEFARAGIGHAGVLWSGGVRLLDVLVAAEALPCRRIVIGLSPLTLAPLENKAMQQLLASRIPPFDPTMTGGAVLRWADAAKEQGRATENPNPFLGVSIDGLVNSHRDTRNDSRQWTQVFDHFIRGRFELVRLAALHPIYAKRWHAGWFRYSDPRASDKRYVHHLRPRDVARREREREEAIALMRELLESGRSIAIARLPIDAGLRRIEDENIPPAILSSIAEDVGVPYLDLMLANPDRSWDTGDGSHLILRDAVSATETIALWLRDDLGWH